MLTFEILKKRLLTTSLVLNNRALFYDKEETAGHYNTCLVDSLSNRGELLRKGFAHKGRSKFFPFRADFRSASLLREANRSQKLLPM